MSLAQWWVVGTLAFLGGVLLIGDHHSASRVFGWLLTALAFWFSGLYMGADAMLHYHENHEEDSQ